ncbi:homeotic protein caudal [Glossina fuscipes]|uniref:Homeotic protein caudal n=1 Tax=Glossina fuscipes TaxID=7396 RepID=A0A9C5ZDQ3_9MUSC|nr:homeotic protein caudal [Glossina fuscipes]
MSSRKDDPVFNVKFVQLVESKPCLWNSTLPEYSKKDEIQKAWQEVANETKDTVRNCRERWRTIRSSFLRSLKLSRTSTGRGKRKYYLSKYLQFLIPYTKTRLKNSASIIAQRKAAAQGNIPSPPPMTRISNMPMPVVSSDETKDSSNSTEVAAIAEGDVVVSLHEGAAMIANLSMSGQHAPIPLPQPLPRLHAIKQEQDIINANQANVAASANLSSTSDLQRRFGSILGGGSNTGHISSTNNHNSASATNPALNGSGCSGTGGGGNAGGNSSGGNVCVSGSGSFPPAEQQRSTSTVPAVDLTEFAEWIKCKHEHQRHCLMTGTSSSNTNTITTTTTHNHSNSNHQNNNAPDADQSFLNSLHPFLKEMSGKQNRRFRQKVVALIDAILDNTD